jgi:hypothetical protein
MEKDRRWKMATKPDTPTFRGWRNLEMIIPSQAGGHLRAQLRLLMNSQKLIKKKHQPNISASSAGTAVQSP